MNSVLIILFVTLYFLTNGIYQNIMMKRVHLGYSPFRPFWHVCGYLYLFSLVLTGYFFRNTVITNDYMFMIYLAGYIGMSKFLVWNWMFYYRDTYFWFNIDERLYISLDIPKIDKSLGFHHNITGKGRAIAYIIDGKIKFLIGKLEIDGTIYKSSGLKFIDRIFKIGV